MAQSSSSAARESHTQGNVLSACRFCGAAAGAHVRRPGHVAAVRDATSRPTSSIAMEPFYPLHVCVCGECFLVQLEEYVAPDEIFTDYAYFSSYSDSWLEHARRYAEAMIGRFELGARARRSSRSRATTATCCSTSSRAASRCLGIEPAANVAEVAVEKGVPTVVRVLRRRDGGGARGARRPRRPAARQQRAGPRARHQRLRRRDEGPAEAAAASITMEFPHLLRLIEEQPVRHDLPRALLATSRFSRSSASSRPRPDDVRRRGAADARRLAADLRAAMPRTTSPKPVGAAVTAASAREVDAA